MHVPYVSTVRLFARLVGAASLLAAALFLSAPTRLIESAHAAGSAQACTSDFGGITLPKGFCATVFADNIGHARQMAVAADGTLYVNTWSGVYYKNDEPPKGGFLVALKDADHDGHAEVTSASARAWTMAATAVPALRCTTARSTRKSMTASCATR
jgi:hypothetical protein